MAISGTSLYPNLFMLKGNTFYDFLESEFSFEIKEIARLQGYSSARSLLHSHRHLLDFIHIKSNDPTLIVIKHLAAFNQNDGTWTIKAGIQYDAEQLMSAVIRLEELETTSRSDDSILVSNDVLGRFPWLKNVIRFCQNSSLVEDRNDLNFLSSFIENLSNNLMKSPNRYRYSDDIEQFALVLSILGRRQVYEYIRINLPGGLPSLTTLSTIFNQNREKLLEGEFRFDSMKNHFESMKVKYAFAAEDCTSVIRKVCYDRWSNSFVGFCPQLQNDGFPQLSSFVIESISDLEIAFETESLSSLLNVYAIRPITSESQHSSPFVLSAFGSDNKFQTHHVIARWLKIFDESLKRGIRILGFSTDCDSRYLRCMRLVMNFFASLPNVDLRQSPNVYNVDIPSNWKWFYLDPKQLFLVFQVIKDQMLSG